MGVDGCLLLGVGRYGLAMCKFFGKSKVKVVAAEDSKFMDQMDAECGVVGRGDTCMGL